MEEESRGDIDGREGGWEMLSEGPMTPEVGKAKQNGSVNGGNDAKRLSKSAGMMRCQLDEG
jgi:hypothetical protein